jgi:two-component system response regulator YesN
MKRILVVDDERPVVEGISLIVRRELAPEFEVAGSASSGREALEKALALAPDIVLMDVRMPGISGLEAIREIRAKGSEAVFILVTAYERFDIAREAVGLGVLDYLLKPVSRDKLALALRAASAFLDRRRELEQKEIEHREAADRLNAFVEASFLQGIVLGEKRGADLALYRQLLRLDEDSVIAVAAAFAPDQDSAHSSAASALHARFRETLRYKTRSLVGPLFDGRCLVLLPFHAAHATAAEAAEAAEAAAASATAAVSGNAESPVSASAAGSAADAANASAAGSAADADRAADAVRADFLSVLESSCADELAVGALRLGFGSARPLEEAGLSWNEAVSDLFFPGGGAATRYATPIEGAQGRPFEADERFLEEALSGTPERAGLALDALLGELRGQEEARSAAGDAGDAGRAGLYRMAALLGAVLRALSRRGLLDPAEAAAMLDMEDLRAAWEEGGFEAAARARLGRIAAVMGRAPRWSQPVAKTMAFIRENYGKQVSLELAADSVGLSPNRLSRLLVEESGRGFSDLLIEYRIEKAKELLREPGASIKQVSAACGYPDPNYFSRLFKKVTGSTPSSFPNGSSEAHDEK